MKMLSIAPMIPTRSVRRLLATGFALSLLVLNSPSVYAQGADGALLDRIGRLERDIRALSLQVYKGVAPADAAAQTGAGPEFSGPVAANLSNRINQLENQIGAVTGQMEEVNFKLRSMVERLDKLVGDVDYRLSALEQARASGQTTAVSQTPAGQPQTPAMNTGLEPDSPFNAQALANPASGPQVLGQLAPKDMSRLSQQAPAPAMQTAPAAQPQAASAAPQQVAAQTSAAPASPSEQYQAARRFLINAEYDKAEASLRSFIEQYPDDPLAGNARYWLGESHYVRGDYVKAAEIFWDGYQRDSKANKAPDTLLKLGMSLSNLGKKKEACAAYSKLEKDFPQLPSNVSRVLVREKANNSCS